MHFRKIKRFSKETKNQFLGTKRRPSPCQAGLPIMTYITFCSMILKMPKVTA